MTAQHFDETLKALCHETPFKAFTVVFQGGRRLEVDFPLAIRDGVAVYLGPRGAPTILTYADIDQIIASSAKSDVG